MRLMKLFCILLVVMLFLCGCSNSNNDTAVANNSPFERKHNVRDDQIKFYDMEWLTEANDIVEKISKSFSVDSYTLTKVKQDTFGDIDLFNYYYGGKDGTGLSWIIDGNELYSFFFNCFSKDNGEHCYLICGGMVVNNSDEAKKSLDKRFSFDSNLNRYVDKNGNFVTIDGSSIDYYCKDMLDLIGISI